LLLPVCMSALASALVASVLVAVDFSPNSEAALEMTAKLASALCLEAVLLHVDPSPETAPLPAEAVGRRDVARSALERSRQSMMEFGVPTVTLLRPGDPAQEILRVALARSPCLIVLGSHGNSPAATPLLGSVADRVVRYSPFPVLVVPDESRRPLGVTGFAAG
jgi:universal stress protein A